MTTPALERLQKLCASNDRICLGLSSGTSSDGVDAALVRIVGSGHGIKVTLLQHGVYPLPDGLRRRIRELNGVKEVCELNFSLGEVFAQAALRLVAEAELEIGDVNLIGSHGQTIYHLPPFLAGVPSTLQIGEGAVIAERTGSSPSAISASATSPPAVTARRWCPTSTTCSSVTPRRSGPCRTSVASPT